MSILGKAIAFTNIFFSGHFISPTMGVSVAGGISHNIGQILVAVFVVKNLNLLFYLPVLMIAGIITGFLIGLVAGLIIPSVRKALQL